jgi:hypothetical protein
MSDLEKRFQRVMGGMVGNEALTESLDENAAGELFAWGEAIVKDVVAETDGWDDFAADEHIAPRLRALRLMMRALARWAGEVDSLEEEARLALWTRAEEQGRVLFGESFALPAMQGTTAQIQPGADPQQEIARLIAIVNAGKPKG